MNRTDYVLTQVCHAYPERYDVHLDGEYIGEISLRWGVLQAHYGPNDEEEVYTTNQQVGAGEFMDDERNHFLNMAVAALDHRHHSPPPPPLPPVVENAEPKGWTFG